MELEAAAREQRDDEMVDVCNDGPRTPLGQEIEDVSSSEHGEGSHGEAKLELDGMSLLVDEPEVETNSRKRKGQRLMSDSEDLDATESQPMNSKHLLSARDMTNGHTPGIYLQHTVQVLANEKREWMSMKGIEQGIRALCKRTQGRKRDKRGM